jgi:maltose alpha-D-glucosyltransferase/alpha-amylase
LGIDWESDNVSALTQQLTLARVRSGPRVGLLSDAFSMDAFPRALIDSWAAQRVLPTRSGGELRFRSGDPDGLALASGGEVRWLGAEQSNSSLIIGESVVIKLVRRVRYGEHPESAFAARLEGTTFRHYARLLGDVVLSDSGGTATIVLAQQFIRNQGDAWTWTQNFFDGAWDEPEADATQSYFSFAAQLGRRLAELHAALAEPTDFADFAPRAASSGDIDAWLAAARDKFTTARDALATHDGTIDLRKRLDRAEADVLDRYRTAHGTLCTRIHGDFHLGQVLVASGDAYLIDFEGDPTLPIEGRTLRQSPLRDLAGLMRSVAYAANHGAATRLARVGASEAADVTRAFGHFAERVRETLLLAYSAHAPAELSLAESANRQLLTAFEVERAAHEVAYEAANRPTWLSLGIASLEDALERLEAAA